MSNTDRAVIVGSCLVTVGWALLLHSCAVFQAPESRPMPSGASEAPTTFCYQAKGVQVYLQDPTQDPRDDQPHGAPAKWFECPPQAWVENIVGSLLHEVHVGYPYGTPVNAHSLEGATVILWPVWVRCQGREVGGCSDAGVSVVYLDRPHGHWQSTLRHELGHQLQEGAIGHPPDAGHLDEDYWGVVDQTRRFAGRDSTGW